MTATSGSSDSINTYFMQKALACHPNFRKCTLTVEFIAVLRVATLIFGENKMAGRSPISTKTNVFQVDYLCQDGFNSGKSTKRFCNATSNFDKCHYIRCYVLNLLLNTQRSHSRSQRAGKSSLILVHDRCPIYRSPTYITVPLIGPHQPRYIGLTLYFDEQVPYSNSHYCSL